MIPAFKTSNVKLNNVILLVCGIFFLFGYEKNHISVTFATFASKCSHELTISKLRTFF